MRIKLFFIIILIKQTYKAKIFQSPGTVVFPLVERKDRNKLKRSEIEVKIIMK